MGVFTSFFLPFSFPVTKVIIIIVVVIVVV